MVADSRRRVADLEARLIDDRRAAANAARRLTALVLRRLSRPDVLVCCYALGTLVGASGADIARHLAALVRRVTALTAAAA
jgi:hypothetical protein